MDVSLAWKKIATTLIRVLVYWSLPRSLAQTLRCEVSLIPTIAGDRIYKAHAMVIGSSEEAAATQFHGGAKERSLFWACFKAVSELVESTVCRAQFNQGRSGTAAGWNGDPDIHHRAWSELCEATAQMRWWNETATGKRVRSHRGVDVFELPPVSSNLISLLVFDETALKEGECFQYGLGTATTREAALNHALKEYFHKIEDHKMGVFRCGEFFSTKLRGRHSPETHHISSLRADHREKLLRILKQAVPAALDRSVEYCDTTFSDSIQSPFAPFSVSAAHHPDAQRVLFEDCEFRQTQHPFF